MLKRLPFLCAALLALAACSHDSGSSGPAQPTPSATATTPAAAASAAPASTMTAATPAAAGSSAPAADSSANAAAGSPAVAAAPFVDDGKWVEGKDYYRIEPAQPKWTSTDKIEVVEAFSYGCPACNAYHATMNQLAKELPQNAVATFLPASFMPQEN